MDETEITNNEYRQFVDWVKDSIAHTILGEDYMIEDDNGNEKVNWDAYIDYTDPELEESLDEMYFPEEQRILGKKEIDPRKLNYVYYWVDYKEAARDVNRLNPDFDRTSVIKEEVVNVFRIH